MLEGRQARYEPGRQRRYAGAVGIDFAEPLLQHLPVDLPGQTPSSCCVLRI